MAWDDVHRDLSKVAEGARETARDVRQLGAGLGRQALVASDNVVTAEYLAANGVLEWISGWAEDGMEGVSIAADQWRYLVEDGFASVSALSRADSIDAYTAIPGDHARRRLGHVREGVDRSFVLAERGWLRSLEPLRSVWRPFFKMVRDDFS
ncbi:MAG: hypothetical protein MK142_07645 [Pseudomonadales bacterium]|nr:hypothetical protein [Pseudomonadales bacterium]MEE2893740.1 hypothetical protein [Pseudomonadota bacterium]